MTPDGGRQVHYHYATGEVVVLDRDSRELRRFPTRRTEPDEGLRLRLSVDGSLLAWMAYKSRGEPDRLAVWEVSTGRLIHESSDFDDTSDPVALTRPSGTRWPIRLRTSFIDRKSAIWGFEGQEKQLLVKCLPDGIYDGQGRLLSRLGGDPDANPTLFLAERVSVTYLIDAQGTVRDHAVRCFVSPDGRWTFVGGRYEWKRGAANQWFADQLPILNLPGEFAELRLVDLDGVSVVAIIPGIDDVRFARDGTFAVATDGTGPIRVYDLPPQFSRAEPIAACAVIALLTAASIRQVYLWRRAACQTPSSS
jgi:hypothetical protein